VRVTRSEAARYSINVDDVLILVLADLNVPQERDAKSLAVLANRLASINDANPRRSAGLIMMPDKHRAAAPRGLADEYISAEKAFNTQHQAQPS
jgi:hypothetical protein